MNLVIISGSARKESITCRVAYYLRDILKDKYTVELIDLRNNDLPSIQHVFTSKENTPEEFQELRDKMTAADAFLLVTPEYNGSYSPALKNLLDHFPKTTYARKAIGIVTASEGAFGGMRAAMQMQQLICALFGIPCPQMLVTSLVDKRFDKDGKLIDESFQRNIDNFLTEYFWLAEVLYKNKSIAGNEKI
jgi:NAD(P)H-dependent FMN reductase